MKHFFSLILLSLIFSVATISVAHSQILPERERATLRDTKVDRAGQVVLTV